MEKLLTKKEREQLISRHRKERDKRICDRIKAVLAFDDGYSYAEIAHILLLDDETIRRHIEEYLRDQKLSTSNGGSEGKLSDKEMREFTEHLQDVTYLYVKDICQYILVQYGITFSISGMTKWLHAHGFCYKKPHAVPAKADKEQQKKFIQYYTRLKKKAGNKEPIYFADSVHPQHQTQMAYGWILKGERKDIPTTAYQKRLNFIGGICLDGHRFIYHQVDQVNAVGICDFLWQLRKANPGKYRVHLIWDNARYHRNDEVKDFAKELGIKLHYLPPYSPNLNPIERIWKLMHESVRYNKYYGKFSEFADATLEFLKGIGRKKCILRERITDNFQILHSPLFAS
jgi:transposase